MTQLPSNQKRGKGGGHSSPHFRLTFLWHDRPSQLLSHRYRPSVNAPCRLALTDNRHEVRCCVFARWKELQWDAWLLSRTSHVFSRVTGSVCCRTTNQLQVCLQSRIHRRRSRLSRWDGRWGDIISLHFAWVVDDAKCIVVTRVCVSVCVFVSVCPRPHAYTIARTRI